MTHLPEVKSLAAYTVGFGVQRTTFQANKRGTSSSIFEPEPPPNGPPEMGGFGKIRQK